MRAVDTGDSTHAPLSDIEQVELIATRFFLDSIRPRDHLVHMAMLTDWVGEDGEAVIGRSPEQFQRPAGLVGRTVASLRQARGCREGVPGDCQIPANNAVVALGEVRLDGEQGEVAVWSWRGTSSACCPEQQLVDDVTLRRAGRTWEATGIRITRISHGRAC